MSEKVLTGAIALIKSKGKVIGRMKSVRIQEQIRRQPVRGIGTILPSEQAATEWDGTLSCEFMEIKFTGENATGIPQGIRRKFSSAGSQVFQGLESFEDQIVLDSDIGVQVDIYKKVRDVINPDGTIIPKAVPHAIVKRCLIESDSLDISEGSIAGHSQSFKYLDPILETP